MSQKHISLNTLIYRMKNLRIAIKFVFVWWLKHGKDISDDVYI